jgi:hypothetical protein
VAFSHFLDPENEHSVTAKKMEEQFLKSPMGRGTFRTWSECAEFLEGLELLPPGLALCADWWPDGPRDQAAELGAELFRVRGGTQTVAAHLLPYPCPPEVNSQEDDSPPVALDEPVARQRCRSRKPAIVPARLT